MEQILVGNNIKYHKHNNDFSILLTDVIIKLDLKSTKNKLLRNIEIDKVKNESYIFEDTFV